MMTKNLPARAKDDVKDAILSCLLAGEADGFQEHETDDWVNNINDISHDDNHIYITMSHYMFRIDIVRIGAKKY